MTRPSLHGQSGEAWPAVRSAWFVVVAASVAMGACTESNQAPFICDQIPPQTVDVGHSISFVPCFADPDGDALEVGVEVVAHLHTPHVAFAVSGETVTIHGRLEYHGLLVAVTATDPGGLSAVQEVEVSVRGLHDLAVLRAWPDTQTVRNGGFQLEFITANVGSTYAKVATWSLHVSSDTIITPEDPDLPGKVIIENTPPYDTAYQRRYRRISDPGMPYFGLCGVSSTPEYNLANNCSRALRVIFPDSMASQVSLPRLR